MKNRNLFFSLIVAFLLAPFIVGAADATSTSFSLESVGFESAGGVGTSTSYQGEQQLPFIDGAVATSTSFMLDAGFSFTSSTTATSSGGSGGGGGGGGGGFVGGGVIIPIPPEPVYPPYIPSEQEGEVNESIPSTGSVLETIAEAIKEFIVPGSKPFIIGKIELEKVVPKVAPLAFRSSWLLLDPQPIKELVFRPLPEELKNLAGEIPQLGKLFSQVGINRFNDLQKLKNISLKVPGLTDVLALPSAPVTGTPLGGVKDISIASLTPELRSKFPKGVLFAKLASGVIDVKPQLTLSENGQTEQVIRTIVGSTLSLSVRPQYEASSVQGFLLFKGRGQRPPVSGVLGKEALASVFDITATSLPPQKEIETALVVSQFPFLDSDGDGIYTATIQAPVVSAEYEILTAITYRDADRGTQLLRMVTVVDPEGYIFEVVDGDKEVRIPRAVVTLLRLNASSQTYEVWPAKEYQQENPQITDATGQYSFLVPPGMYQITVDAPGYTFFTGMPFEVREGRGVHENIKLETSFAFFKAIDWKTAALMISFLLILYNFYRDRRRDSPRTRSGASPP